MLLKGLKARKEEHMKYSEALRAGAKKGKQLFNESYDGQGGTCAYWAIEAGGLSVPPTRILAREDVFFGQIARCPADCGARVYTDGATTRLLEGYLFQMILHLNNDHHWTREAIADWIEANVERELIPAQEIREYCGMAQA